MSTISLNADLQDYLKKSTTSGSSTWASNFQNSSVGRFPWFGTKDSAQQESSDENVANGWLSEAQNDPWLPNLVRQLIYVYYLSMLLK